MIIDFHVHLFPRPFRENRSGFFADVGFKTLYASPKSKLVGAAELLERMDEEEVDKAVVFGFPWEDREFYRRHNDYIMEVVSRRPDRLAGFGCFSLLAPDAASEAERCLKGGLSGIGELASYGTGLEGAALETLGDVLKLCADSDAPLLLHTNEPVGHDYPGKAPMTLLQVYNLVKAFPSNRIVLAHWGGGLLFYGLMKKEVKTVLKNVWFDTAASPYLYGPEIYRVAGEIVGVDKILFGSDYPLLPPGRYFEEMKSSGLNAESLRKVQGENAARLLGLTQE